MGYFFWPTLYASIHFCLGDLPKVPCIYIYVCICVYIYACISYTSYNTAGNHLESFDSRLIDPIRISSPLGTSYKASIYRGPLSSKRMS